MTRQVVFPAALLSMDWGVKDPEGVSQHSRHPTYAFLQEVLSHGSDVEVLSPLWFRQQVADVASEMNNIYDGGETDAEPAALQNKSRDSRANIQLRSYYFPL